MNQRMKLLGLFVGLFLACGQARALEYDRYHSQGEINQYMRTLAEAFPELVKFSVLGKSPQNREISYIIISRAEPGSVPAIYLNGTHHGNEKSSTETTLGVMDYLLANQNNPRVSELLDNYAIYLQPLVNPDGHAANRRDDTMGRDPNRDYSYPDRPDAQSFKVPVVKLVKNLVDSVRFRAAIAYHSGMEAVLWPWCYTNRVNPDQDIFKEVSKRSAQAMGMRRFAQSYQDYPTSGEFIDYVYMKHQTLAVTFEVSQAGNPAPSQLAAAVQRAVKGTMEFLYSIQTVDQFNSRPRSIVDNVAALINPWANSAN